MKRILLPLLLLLAALSARAQTTTVSVDNVAALVALSTNGLSAVNLLGYYSPGDGGGGLLYLTNTWTGTNLVTRYASSTANCAWQREVSKPLSPRWAGAKGDFNTDDTAAVQACFDWVDPNIGNTNQSMLAIRFDDGWYSVTSVTNTQWAEIFGARKTRYAGFSTKAPGIFQRAGAVGAAIYSPGRLYAHDLQLYGRASANLQNVNTITTVTDRFNFSVASTNFVPTSPFGFFPYGGVCLFYTTNNTLVGSGMVASVSGGTNIMLAPNYDWFATDTGSSSNLTTGWKVCFTPWSNWNDVYGRSPVSGGGNYAPVGGELGNAGIELVSNSHSVIEHCNISGFCTGVAARGCATLSVRNSDFYSSHLAAVWLDNTYDSVFDNVYAQGQPLSNGVYANEYAGVSGGALYQLPHIADAPAQDTYYCQTRSLLGGWHVGSSVANHLILDFGAVGINFGGSAPVEMLRLDDATIDNTVQSVVVLDHVGYLHFDWMRWFLSSDTRSSSGLYPAIRTLGSSSFIGGTLELINLTTNTGHFTRAIETSQGTPVFTPVLPNLVLIPDAAANVVNPSQPNDPAGAVIPFETAGKLPSGTTLAGDATTAFQPTTLQQVGVIGTLATNAMPKAGGTFTGAVTLAGDATAVLQPTTLQQVGVVGTLATNAMPKAGGTFTGSVTLAGDATAVLEPTTLQQVGVVGTLATNAMPKAGGTFTGAVTLAGDATAVLQPTTLQQVGVVGTLATNAMPKAGGTFTGAVTLNADPVSGLQPATKQYVDNNFLADSGGTVTGATTFGSDVSVTGNLTTTGNFTARPATGKNLTVTAGTGVDVSAADNAGTTYVPLKVKASAVTQNDGTRDLLATARNTGASMDYQIHGTGSTPTLSWTDAGLIGWGDYTSATSALNSPFQWRINGINLKLSTNYLAGTTVPTIRLAASDDSFGPRPFKFQGLSHNFTTDSDASYVFVLTNNTAAVHGPLTVSSTLSSGGALSVGGTSSLTGDVTATGNEYVGGNLAVTNTFFAGGHVLSGTSTDDGTGAAFQSTVPGGGNALGMSTTSYGGSASLYLRAAAGTQASPTAATTSNTDDITLRLYNGSSFIGSALLRLTPTSTQSGSNSGGDFTIGVTPDGSTTRANAFKVAGAGDISALIGNVTIDTAGKGLAVKYGTNCKLGSFTLSGGTATVNNTSITANSVVFFTLTSASGTVGIAPYVSAVTAGTSFGVQAGGADNSTYKYFIVEAQ